MGYIVIEVANHVKNRVRTFRKVREYKRIRVFILSDFPKHPAFNIGRYPRLSRLQNQRSYIALIFELLLKLFVNPLLTHIEPERNRLAFLVYNL